MIAKSDLDTCRRGMQAYIGRRIKLKSSGGRKRTIIQEGVLESCYPNVFTVRCSQQKTYQEMVSFSYVDILTKVVEVAVEPDPKRRQHCNVVH